MKNTNEIKDLKELHGENTFAFFLITALSTKEPYSSKHPDEVFDALKIKYAEWKVECGIGIDKPERIERTYSTNPGDTVQLNIKTSSGTKVIYFIADERGYTDDSHITSVDRNISIIDDIEVLNNQKLFLYFDCDGNFGRRDYQYEVDDSGTVEFIGRGTLLKKGDGFADAKKSS